MSWNNDIVLEFIELYKRENILWDPKHPSHKNRSEVSDAWERIQSCLSINCTVNELKRKKESLMTSFRLHWNKKKKQNTYRTSWFAFPLMASFLGGRYENEDYQETEHEFFDNTAVYMPDGVMPDRNTTRHITTTDRSNTAGRHMRPSVSHRTSSNNNSDHHYARREMHESMSYAKQSPDKRDMDEYDLYGQLLAKKLRKLDEHQRDIAMHDIDNIMFRAKMKSGTSQARSYSSSPSPSSRKIKSPVFIVTAQNHSQFEDENVPYQEQILQGQSET